MNKLLLYQHFFSFSFSQTFFISIATSSQRSKKNELTLSVVKGAQFLEKTLTLRNLRQTFPQQRRTPLKNKQIRLKYFFSKAAAHNVV